MEKEKIFLIKNGRKKALHSLKKDEWLALFKDDPAAIVGLQVHVQKPKSEATYTALEGREYVNKLGYPTLVVKWEAKCCICERPFICESGINPVKCPATCPAHRMTLTGRLRRYRPPVSYA